MKVTINFYLPILLNIIQYLRRQVEPIMGWRVYQLFSILAKKRLSFTLLYILLATGAFSQGTGTFVVSGKVVDDSGLALPGVGIVVQGASTSTVTNTNGSYSIRVPGANSVLVFRFLGMETREIRVGNNKVLNVSLRKSNERLDEVVVIGYGTTTRRDLTGAVAQVKMADLEKAPVKSFDEALAGRVAGVSVGTSDGQPGSNTNVVIRGAGTLTQNPTPLYVIDGFPSEDANSNSINPSDIESMEVLKDASATAIYGARGANGVIIITTKKGKAGAPVINYNGYAGFAQNPKTISLMNAYEFVKYQAELEPVYAQNAYLNKMPLEDYRNVESIDMQDRIYTSNPLSHNHELSIRGGNATTTYSISGNILDQNGLIINSGFNRYQGRFSLDQVINKKIKVGTNFNYAATKTYGAIASETAYKYTYSSLALMYSVWGFRPVAASGEQLIDEFFDPDASAGDFRVNPIISAENELRETKVNSLAANAWAQFTLAPGLTFRSQGGISQVMVNRNIFNNSLTANGNFRRVEGVNGSVIFNPINTWSNENILTYSKTFNNDHNLNVVGGFTLQSQNNEYYGLEAQQVLNEDLGIDGLDEAETSINFSNRSSWTMSSFLGRARYNYKSKYYFTTSFRYDGSSKFAPGKRWAFFPSADVSWRMKDEPFFKEVDFISDAKLRVSYGASGNNRVSDFPYLTQLTVPRFGGYSFNNANPTRGAVLFSYGNEDLRWETTLQSNIGYDLSLFKGRLNLTADVYRKVTKDLLIEANLPYSTGLTNIYNRATAYKNIGKLRNQGLELSLNTTNFDKKNFKWTTNFNISFNQNKILELYEDIASIAAQVAFDSDFSNTPSYLSPVNQSAGQMYGLIWDGVYQYEDFDQILGTYILKDNITTNGQARSTIQPGDIKYKDINGDMKVDLADFTVIGRGNPIHTGGFTNNFNYKGFDLNVFFQWSYGNDIINANRLIFEGNAKRSRALNQYASYAERWQPDNPSNTLFRTGGQKDAYFSSRVVEDGSFLRLKTVSLGYNFDATWVKRMRIKSFRTYVSAQNLHTWTNYSGSNPDVSTRHSVLTPGFDFASYPLARTLVFGISASL